MNNNPKIKHICFDLDGTLVRSHITIYKATLKALNDLNIPSENLIEGNFYERIGYHFTDIFNEFNIPVKNFEAFISIYKNQYFNFINESELYENVAETLNLLNSKKIKISLLTTKGQDQAEKIIEHFGLEKYFDLIMGRRDGIAHKPSPEPLQLICKNLNTACGETLIVGDTELDIICGKNAGTKTCAVTYGYGTKKALEKQEPELIINSIKELTVLNL